MTERESTERTRVSYPFALDLTDEQSWYDVDRPKRRVRDKFSRRFRIVRFHYVLDDRPTDGAAHRMGASLGAYSANESTVELVKQISVDLAMLRIKETLQSAIFTEDFLKEIFGSLDGLFGPGLVQDAWRLDLSQLVKELLDDRLSGLTQILDPAIGVETTTFDVDSSRTHRQGEGTVNVAMYRRRKVEMSLVWLDVLEVDYGRSTLGLRKKRVKYPDFIEQRTRKLRPNEINLDYLVGTFEYWRLVPQKSWMIPEDEFRLEVENPHEIRRRPLTKLTKVCLKSHFQEPSLYRISNATFPLKWIKRTGPWEREDLLAIEENEV